MNKVDEYSVYQKSRYDNKINNKEGKTGKTEKKKKAEETGKAGAKPVQLSARAKALLEELKKKYGNMDFFVADYSSEEEAQSYLSRGTKQYSVLIEPDVLEEMAADEDAKNKYLGVIDGAKEQLDGIKEQLGTNGENVKNIGFTVSKDGSVSFFAELEKSSAKQRERIDETREEKRTQKKEEEKRAEKEKRENRTAERAKSDYGWSSADLKRTTVRADSIDELVRKIKEVDWDSVEAEHEVRNGGKFDFSV